MVAHVLGSLAAAGAVVLAYGLLLIVQTHPWWDAQRSLPILAMLLGITISAVSAGLSAALNDLAQGITPPPPPSPACAGANLSAQPTFWRAGRKPCCSFNAF